MTEEEETMSTTLTAHVRNILIKLNSVNYLFQGLEDTAWTVGCYKINPTTHSGQKFFILHMLVLPLIPITALVIQVSHQPIRVAHC